MDGGVGKSPQPQWSDRVEFLGGDTLLENLPQRNRRNGRGRCLEREPRNVLQLELSGGAGEQNEPDIDHLVGDAVVGVAEVPKCSAEEGLDLERAVRVCGDCLRPWRKDLDV